jgi:hypothetical protein
MIPFYQTTLGYFLPFLKGGLWFKAPSFDPTKRIGLWTLLYALG